MREGAFSNTLSTLFDWVPTVSNRAVLAALIVILVAVAGALLPVSPSPVTITLPIEVYPLDGESTHVEEITLNVDNAGSVDSLYVKAHQPFYHRGGILTGEYEGFDVQGAASIQINDGPWIDVRNENVGCARSERIHTQCVGGVFSTIRFTIPASTVQEGPNRIRFRFNGTKGARSGYRVLGVGFMRSSDPSVETFDPQTHGAHDASVLQYEDFSSWDAPNGYDSPSDVSDGKNLFETAQLIERPNGETIRASCSDCHARDGRDLKYFNYSNRTITARSRFHGLSAEEGRKIAAYIRSINLEKRDGSTYEAPGTPWDPPYQPGPELKATGKHPDKSNQVFWAAGAGLDWVLNRDRQMLPYVFPDGQGGVDYYETAKGNQALNWQHVHMDSTLNMREIPVSVQFPDWNNWLPDVHPKDAFPSTWDGSGAKSTYENDLRSALETYSGDFNKRDLNTIAQEIQNLHLGSNSLTQAGNESNFSSNQFSLARLSAYQWVAMKVWESMHMHHLEDVADEMYGDDPTKPYNEPRSWIGRQRTLFDLAPHISANVFEDSPYLYGSQTLDYQMSHVWYQLQVTVNPGAAPESNSQQPVDWNYQYSFLQSVPDVGLRMVTSLVKSMQIMSNGYGVDGTGGDGYDRIGLARGWEPFSVDPARFMRLNGNGEEYSNLPADLREDLFTATLRSWNDYTTQFSVDDFPRGDDNRRYAPSSYVPQSSGWTSSRDHAQKIYQELLRTGDKWPEAYGAMDTLASWGKKMWPNTDGPDWDDIVDAKPPQDGVAPSLTITSPSSNSSMSAPASLKIAAEADDPDGTPESVAFFVGDTQIGTDDSAPFEVEVSDLPAHTYRVVGRVRDNEGLTGRDTLTFTVDPNSSPTAPENGLYYTYFEKSLSVLPDFPSLFPESSGQVSEVSLSMDTKSDHFAVRFHGYIEIPEDGTYTFYTTSDDGSKLWINDREVVDNDGRHAMIEQSGEVTLEAGYHALEVGYFEKDGGNGLEVEWSGPNVSKSPIPSERLYISTPTTHLTLHEGWNLISTPVVPDEADLQSLLGPIESELVIVKNDNGDTYLPDFGIDEINTWKSREAYKVYVENDQTLSVVGERLESTTTIPLNKGWNFVPYFPKEEMPPGEALQSITDQLVILKDETGNRYVPSSSINEVELLKPGRSYQVYVESAVDLTYPSSGAQ